ncbi:purine-nucleoside phosphorylase [Helicobacter turcicus]|uniref:Purine-nucleoside phosphorylase n=1 Tax=Helicobacter turcicus TaxID=2867412 RepID=A0ABS7JPW4_9HELI|nr:purine-nucleoside phosphorylase [Helicobacter turcicus]MBX7491434.1 purine-nucleoside phosphorylase [Helicobacter turcicus]MBX7545894.1 purine-nucleoside phosphorylase [Helicobacter turcicus]
MIYCAGKIENFAFAKSIGVGLVESSINLTRSILHDKPDEIVFVGTCGSYSIKKPLLEIFESSSACNIELSFLQEQSYTPLNNFLTNVSCETMPKDSNTSIQMLTKAQKIINSSNYITTDAKLAEHFVKLGILYENMEFFSVLQVAQAFNLPAIGIFCSTNYIHKDAQKEFLANHKVAMQKLESYVKNKLDSTLGV